ncbi:MAG: helix-turn-helix domain-containing protein [Thermocladium sp.]
MMEKHEELDVNILVQDLINSVDTQDPAQVRIVINIIKKLIDDAVQRNMNKQTSKEIMDRLFNTLDSLDDALKNLTKAVNEYKWDEAKNLILDIDDLLHKVKRYISMLTPAPLPIGSWGNYYITRGLNVPTPTPQSLNMINPNAARVMGLLNIKGTITMNEAITRLGLSQAEVENAINELVRLGYVVVNTDQNGNRVISKR